MLIFRRVFIKASIFRIFCETASGTHIASPLAPPKPLPNAKKCCRFAPKIQLWNPLSNTSVHVLWQ